MATALSLLPSIESPHYLPLKKLQPSPFPLSLPLSKQNPNFRHYPPPLCASHSSDPSPSITYPQNPLPGGRFLTPSELDKVEILDNFTYRSDLPRGRLRIRAMRGDELDVTSKLLAESFSEAMVWPSGYVNLLIFLVKNYLVERRSMLPHAITLLGFYTDDNDVDDYEEEGEGELAGTVEVSFDKMGANATPPTPIPPKNCPYICNMTVKFSLRRRGIGWHLLKASEQLISQMTSSSEVYLHCRLIDTAPFNMYKKAGYEVVKTDNILVLLSLQRRKHLMRKILPALMEPYEVVGSQELTQL